MIKEKQYDIEIESGADFQLLIKLTDPEGTLVDLTGATVEAQMREYPESPHYIDFSVSHSGEGGTISMMMSHLVTEKISYTRGVYDVFVNFETERDRVLFGNVTIFPTVTKGAQ